MDIRSLRLFDALATSLHFGKTSRLCNITPSALTRTIQRLENEVGAKLFQRDNRSVSLTGAGEAFARYAADVLQRWNELQNELAADDILQGEISLYCSVTAAYSILPSILGRFRSLYPAIHINLQTGDAAQSLTKLQNGETDVAIAALPDKMPAGLEVISIMETPLVFIAPSRFPETVRTDGNSIDWEKTPLIVPEQGLSRERLDRWLAEHRIRPNIYAQVAGNEAIIAMVSLGCGVGLVPELVLKKSPLPDQITLLKNTPRLQPFAIGICIATRQLLQPKIRAFRDIASQEETLLNNDRRGR